MPRSICDISTKKADESRGSIKQVAPMSVAALVFIFLAMMEEQKWETTMIGCTLLAGHIGHKPR
jgi:hypothetical protein